MSTRLFVGNLSPDSTREDLETVFSQVGEVAGIRIAVDRETNRPRGFAFVEFVDPAEAATALEALDGSLLAGRPLRLSWAQEHGGKRSGRGFRPDRTQASRNDQSVRTDELGRGQGTRPTWSSERQDDDYAGKRRTKPRARRHGGHGNDRKRGRGTRRFLE